MLLKSLKEFLNRMDSLKSRLQRLFPLQFIPKLRMEHVESLELIVPAVNKRILKQKPPGTTNLCGSLNGICGKTYDVSPCHILPWI